MMNNKFDWINFTFVELPSAFVKIPLPKLKTHSFLGFWFLKFWWPKLMRNWFSIVYQNGCTYRLLSKLNIFRLHPPSNIISHFQIQANGFSAIQCGKRSVIEHIWKFISLLCCFQHILMYLNINIPRFDILQSHVVIEFKIIHQFWAFHTFLKDHFKRIQGVRSNSEQD